MENVHKCNHRSVEKETNSDNDYKFKLSKLYIVYLQLYLLKFILFRGFSLFCPKKRFRLEVFMYQSKNVSHLSNVTFVHICLGVKDI